jgi:hypothetical protein
VRTLGGRGGGVRWLSRCALDPVSPDDESRGDSGRGGGGPGLPIKLGRLLVAVLRPSDLVPSAKATAEGLGGNTRFTGVTGTGEGSGDLAGEVTRGEVAPDPLPRGAASLVSYRFFKSWIDMPRSRKTLRAQRDFGREKHTKTLCFIALPMPCQSLPECRKQ